MRGAPTACRNARRGAIAVYLALSLTAVLGVLAVVLDGGLLLAERQRAQGVADAAALAAAADLFANYLTNHGVDSGSAATSAATVANANGYTNGNSTITVRVYPANYLGGPHAGAQVPAGYAEATVTYNQARFFSSIWGAGTSAVSARAVARGQWVAVSPAILALDPTDSGTILTTGNGSISVTGGGYIVDDSSSASGITVSGQNALVSNPGGILVSGSPGISGGGTVSPAPVFNPAPMPDPLRFMPDPPQGTLQSVPVGATITLQPGYYAGGLSFSGNTTVTLNPGVYYINTTLSTGGQASLSGTGVMLFLGPNGSLSLGGSGSVTLSPLTSGAYQGLTVFQSRSNTNPVTVTGSGSFSITGTIYAAGATVSATGNGDSVGSQIIAYQVQNKGAGQGGAISIAYDGAFVAKTRILNLVE